MCDGPDVLNDLRFKDCLCILQQDTFDALYAVIRYGENKNLPVVNRNDEGWWWKFQFIQSRVMSQTVSSLEGAFSQ